MERAASSVKGDALALKLQRDKELMVASHIMDRGISHPITIESMGAVPREAFVPGSMKELAYADRPLPIGEDQTISQPYIVALMIDACQPKPTDRALEIGSGSGYATAVLSLCVSRVVAVERIQKLAERSARVLDLLGILRSTSFPFDMQKSKGRVDKYEEDVRGKFEGKLNVDLFVGDGTVGVEEEGPFDIIIVSAAAPAIPQSLVRQLADGGRLILPVGELGGNQVLLKITRRGGKLEQDEVLPVIFVPLIGREGFSEEEVQQSE